MALCMVNAMAKQPARKPFVVLFDSGSSHTWWNIKSLPPGAVPRKVESSSSATLAGDMTSNLEIDLEDVTFPEFFKSRRLCKIEARVFTAECRYDAIIGRDVLRDIGIKLDFKDNKMTWDECHVPMKVFCERCTSNPHGIKEPSVTEQLYMEMIEADLEDDDTYPTCDMTDCSSDEEWDDDVGNDHAALDDDDMYAAQETGINVSKYETADIDKVVRSCTHLDQTQQNDLRAVLEKYPKLFDNELGTYPDEKIHLDVKANAIPHCQPRAYSVPHVHQSTSRLNWIGWFALACWNLRLDPSGLLEHLLYRRNYYLEKLCHVYVGPRRFTRSAPGRSIKW